LVELTAALMVVKSELVKAGLKVEKMAGLLVELKVAQLAE
jgi:hypothetical protein